MTYDEAQALSQLVSMAIFMSLLAGAVFYAFRRANKSKFEHLSKLPLADEDLSSR